MSEHTKTPWRVGRIDRQTQTAEINAPHGHHGGGLNYTHWTAFVECMGANEQPDEGIAAAEANARHIVHCVNNHERLVEALRNALSCMESDLEQIEGEWGMGRSLESLERDGELTEEIIEARALLAELDAGK